MSEQIVLDVNLDIDLKQIKEFESELKSNYNDDSIRLKIDKSLYLTTSNSDTHHKLLNQSNLKFAQTYVFKPSHSPGYKSNCFYPLNERDLIVKNIEHDELIVRMYAEYLLPDNDLASLAASKLVSNTFYLTYSDVIDRTKLTTRFNKKPNLNKWKIELLDSYATRSLLVWSHSKLDLNKFNLTNLFYELYSNKYLLVQFESSAHLDEFALQLGEEFSYELVHNFDLIRHLLQRKFESKNQVKSVVTKPAKPIVNLPFFKQLDVASHFNIDSLIKMELNYVFYLNELEPLVIGLLNASQLLADFNLSLARIDYECKLDAEKRPILQLKNTVESSAGYDTRKQMLTDLISEFYCGNFVYQIFELKKNSSEMSSQFGDYCAQLNKRFTAVYLNYSHQHLYSYSSINSFSKVVKHLENYLLLNSVKSVSNPIKSTNKTIYSSNAKFTLPKVSNDSPQVIHLNVTYPILAKSVLNCAKILNDFKSDLKTVDADLYESDSGLCVKYGSSDQLSNFLSNYERNLLREEVIALSEQFSQEDAMSQLLKQILNETGINDLKQIMTVFYKSDKVVQVELSQANEFEVYGYAKAVTGFKEYILKQIDKTLHKLARQDELKLEFKVKLPSELSEALFQYFDGIYLNDLVKRLESLRAFATHDVDNSSLLIGCLDKKVVQANKKKKNAQVSREITEWRSCLDEFFGVYVDRMRFAREILDTPFKRVDSRADEFMYDKNSLDLKWIADMQVEVFGLCAEIQKLKQRLLLNC